MFSRTRSMFLKEVATAHYVPVQTASQTALEVAASGAPAPMEVDNIDTGDVDDLPSISKETGGSTRSGSSATTKSTDLSRRAARFRLFWYVLGLPAAGGLWSAGGDAAWPKEVQKRMEQAYVQFRKDYAVDDAIV